MVEELQEKYIEPHIRAMRLEFWKARLRLNLESDDQKNRTDYVDNPKRYTDTYNRRLEGQQNR